MWQVWFKNETGEWELSNEHNIEALAMNEASFLIIKGLEVSTCWVD